MRGQHAGGQENPCVRAIGHGTFVLSCVVALLMRDNPFVATAACLLAVYSSIVLRFEWLAALPGGTVARRLLRTGIYFLPLVVLGPPELGASPVAVAVAVAVAAVLLFAQRREIAFSLDRGLARLRPPVIARHRAANAVHVLSAAPAQEYLHRFCVITLLAPHIGPLAVLVGVVTFHLDHALQRKRFDLKDEISHAVISVACGLLVFVADSWLSAVVLHGLYNLPRVIEWLLRSSPSAEQHEPNHN